MATVDRLLGLFCFLHSQLSLPFFCLGISQCESEIESESVRHAYPGGVPQDPLPHRGHQASGTAEAPCFPDRRLAFPPAGAYRSAKAGCGNAD